MAAAEPVQVQWTVRVRERVDEARAHCDVARALLTGAAASLAQPMHVADAPGGSARAELLRGVLVDASSHLAAAEATMKAAELLALRGAAATPTETLPSVYHIPDAHASVRQALVAIRRARDYARNARDTLGRCSKRLLTGYNLLDHPGLPDVDAVLDAERIAARQHLAEAENLAWVSALITYAVFVLCLLQ